LLGARFETEDRLMCQQNEHGRPSRARRAVKRITAFLTQPWITALGSVGTLVTIILYWSAIKRGLNAFFGYVPTLVWGILIGLALGVGGPFVWKRWVGVQGGWTWRQWRKVRGALIDLDSWLFGVQISYSFSGPSTVVAPSPKKIRLRPGHVINIRDAGFLGAPSEEFRASFQIRSGRHVLSFELLDFAGRETGSGSAGTMLSRSGSSWGMELPPRLEVIRVKVERQQFPGAC